MLHLSFDRLFKVFVYLLSIVTAQTATERLAHLRELDY